MEKLALDIDPKAVARYGAGGLLTGGSAAALINLANMIGTLNKQRRKSLEEEETDENTIVLTLPPKRAEITEANDVPNKVTTTQGPASSTSPGIGSQARRMDGTVGAPTRLKLAAGWPTLTTSWLAGLAGTGVGFNLVNRVYEKRREKQLEEELSAAQQEYMDQLQGTPKMGCVADAILPDDLVKSAGDPSFGNLSYPVAAAALLSILGAGGSAYITKRILDDKLRSQEDEGLDIPKIKKIRFRTMPTPMNPEDEEEGREVIASADDIEMIKAALYVYMDALSDNCRVLNDPEVKTAMAAAGTSAGKLIKSAQLADDIFGQLTANPELMKRIRAAGARNYKFNFFGNQVGIPGLSTLANLPGFSAIANKKLLSMMRGMPQFSEPPGVASKYKGLGDGIGTSGLMAGGAGRKLASDKQGGWKDKLNAAGIGGSGMAPGSSNIPKDSPVRESITSPKPGGSWKDKLRRAGIGTGLKSAADKQAAGFGGIMQSMIGSELAERNNARNPGASADSIARAIVKAQKEEEQAGEPASTADIAEEVEIGADDPQAEEYLEQNQARVQAALRMLAEQKKL